MDGTIFFICEFASPTRKKKEGIFTQQIIFRLKSYIFLDILKFIQLKIYIVINSNNEVHSTLDDT